MVYQIGSENASAKIKSMGGELVSFIHNSIEYIWGGNPEYWASHTPVLFPTVGALINKETEINGVTYQMNKHGFARNCEFELINQTRNSVVLSLKSNDKTKASYPFEFELIVTHTISDKGFKTEYKVMNKDKSEILFGIGGHTGFNCPLFKNTQFSDYVIEFEQIEDGPFYYTRTEDCGGVIHREDRITGLEGKKELRLDYSLFDRDVIIVDKFKSNIVKLLNIKNNKGLEFKINGFSSIGFWTPPLKKAPFICLEPWTVNPDFSDNSGKFSEKPDITKLSPGKEFSVSYEMNII